MGRPVAKGFASFAFDWVNFEHIADATVWFQEPKRVALIKQLASSMAGDAVVRIGGTTGDRIFYKMDESSVDLNVFTLSALPPSYQVAISAGQMSALCTFARSSGVKLIFGLNGGPGPRANHFDGAWNASNALTLIRYLRKIQCPIYGFELGNEPNLYLFNFGVDAVVTPSRLAADFQYFRKIVDAEYFDVPTSQRPLIIGPDIAFQVPFAGEVFPNFMTDFLQDVGEHVVDVVTWHWYPLQSDHCPLWFIDPHGATPADMIEIDTLDLVAPYAMSISADVQKFTPASELWLGETASASCGGQQNVSDAFCGSLWYLDQLGFLASSVHDVKGTSRSIRQEMLTAPASSNGDYSAGFYSLISDKLEVRPDYFVNILWSRLFGSDFRRVTSSSSTLRAYAAESPSNSSLVSMLLLNFDSLTSVAVTIPEMSPGERYEWLLTAPALESKTLFLNGAALQLSSAGNLPHLAPRHVLDGGPCLVPPLAALVVQAVVV